LNLHRLSEVELEALLTRLEENELDEYGDIGNLIGIEFDDNTVWGQLTVLELKLLIHLALKQWDEAQELVGAFLQYNDNTAERALFYRAMDAVLAIQLSNDRELADYTTNLRRMFGDAQMDAVLGSIDGSVRFYGLNPSSIELEGFDRHRRLLDSYQKLHAARAMKKA
jgi:ribosomal protein S12 methylthiotransferase accessory factor